MPLATARVRPNRTLQALLLTVFPAGGTGSVASHEAIRRW